MVVIDRTKDVVYVFTDGSCNNKTKDKGGYGFVVIYKEHEKHVFGGPYIGSTSARMELMAILKALQFITNKNIKIELFGDNQYTIYGISQKWAFKWEQDGWINRLNSDLWKEILHEYRKFNDGNVKFNWIKGHSGIYFNEIADKLASKGASSEVCVNI